MKLSQDGECIVNAALENESDDFDVSPPDLIYPSSSTAKIVYALVWNIVYADLLKYLLCILGSV
jgi:hypothetical protein